MDAIGTLADFLCHLCTLSKGLVRRKKSINLLIILWFSYKFLYFTDGMMKRKLSPLNSQ